MQSPDELHDEHQPESWGRGRHGGVGVISAAVRELQENFHIRGHHFQKLPMPERLEAEGLPQGEFHRLAVAWGLSFRGDDIGGVLPPHDTPDTELILPRRDPDGGYVSKDQV